MEGACPGTAATCPGAGLSGGGALFFTSLITALLQSERDLWNPDQYPIDAGHYLRNEYDFVIVGGGTVGSIVAARLSEVPDWNVLVIEAGGDPPLHSSIPNIFFTAQKTEIDWRFRTEPQENSCLGFNGRQCNWPRGKVLGGTSVINAMLYIRGLKEDYDSWANNGNEGWGYNDVLEFFKKAEDFKLDEIETELSAQYHGTGGPMSIQRFQILDLASQLMEAAKEKGYAELDDINGPNQHGFAHVHGTISNGTRCNTAKAFLGQAKGRKNLHVLKNSHVKRIIVDPETKIAKAVEFTSKDGTEHTVNVKNEVILSAGTINSPQILMLSGIGPKEHLKEFEITPIIDLKVGENLQDQLLFLGSSFVLRKPGKIRTDALSMLDASYEYLRHRTGLLSTHVGLSLVGFVKTPIEPEDPRPDIELMGFTVLANNTEVAAKFGSRFDLLDESVSSLREMIMEGDILFLAPALGRPKSRGKILLKSTNPLDYPEIHAGYFSDPRDVETIIEGMKIAADIMDTDVMKSRDVNRKQLFVQSCQEFEYDSHDYWECIVRHLTTSGFRSVGTCKMGPSSDPNAVVDPRLKVHGVKGIRVADASIMPSLTTPPIYATTIMIGEKAADMIKKDWLE
ncbi:Glucose dehydrogenase [FAD, quinone] [Blattella germanica]|nr:Glucose dehydrogenase [FAD, quinone] [Blattella germanica]